MRVVMKAVKKLLVENFTCVNIYRLILAKGKRPRTLYPCIKYTFALIFHCTVGTNPTFI